MYVSVYLTFKSFVPLLREIRTYNKICASSQTLL